MSTDVASIVEDGECAAFVEIYNAAPADMRAMLGLRVAQIGTATAFLSSRIDLILFNRVIGLGLHEPATRETIDAVKELYREAGIRRFAVQLPPTASPASLPEELVASGFQRQTRWAKMIREPEPTPAIETDLVIEEIGADRAETFGQTAARGFDMPPASGPWSAAAVGRPGWRHYLAYDGAQPVATAALYINGTTGWLGLGSTLASHRGRGGQGALMARRITDAAASGCRWIITETGEDTPERSNPSYRNMLRTGFRLAYMRPNYITT